MSPHQPLSELNAAPGSGTAADPTNPTRAPAGLAPLHPWPIRQHRRRDLHVVAVLLRCRAVRVATGARPGRHGLAGGVRCDPRDARRRRRGRAAPAPATGGGGELRREVRRAAARMGEQRRRLLGRNASARAVRRAGPRHGQIERPRGLAAAPAVATWIGQ